MIGKKIDDIMPNLNPNTNEMLQSTYFNFEFNQDLMEISRIKSIWEEKWEEIDFGDHILGEYLNFCNYRKDLSPEFFTAVNTKLRCVGF